MKTEEEAKDCISYELQPYRHVINEGSMQYIDESESDDHAMKNE